MLLVIINVGNQCNLEIKNVILELTFVLEQISTEDIQRVAKRILSSEPSVAARGRLSAMPSFKHVSFIFDEKHKKYVYQF